MNIIVLLHLWVIHSANLSLCVCVCVCVCVCARAHTCVRIYVCAFGVHGISLEALAQHIEGSEAGSTARAMRSVILTRGTDTSLA